MNGCKTKYQYVEFEQKWHSNNTLEWDCLDFSSRNVVGYIITKDKKLWFRGEDSKIVTEKILQDIVLFMSRRMTSIKRLGWFDEI